MSGAITADKSLHDLFSFFGKTFPPGWMAVNLKGISSFISGLRVPAHWNVHPNGQGRKGRFPQNLPGFDSALLGIYWEFFTSTASSVSANSQFAFLPKREFYQPS